MLGGTMAAIITVPALANVQIAGKALVPGRGGVIAVLLVVAFSSWFERQIRKIIPEVLDLFMTPLLTVLIAGFAAILILQPIGGFISESIGEAVKIAIKSGGAAIAVLAKTKSKRLKKTILSGLPAGILGVGEPLIYGVTLPLGSILFSPVQLTGK